MPVAFEGPESELAGLSMFLDEQRAAVERARYVGPPLGPEAARASQLLEAERVRVEARLADLERDFDAVVAASDSANLDDEHDPEGSTAGFERAQVRALLDQARSHLAELDAAAQRVADETYGVCVRCGKPIGADRLGALPTTQVCVDCAGRG
jgi:RNA polymerase-binding transcription factor DksA